MWFPRARSATMKSMRLQAAASRLIKVSPDESVCETNPRKMDSETRWRACMQQRASVLLRYTCKYLQNSGYTNKARWKLLYRFNSDLGLLFRESPVTLFSWPTRVHFKLRMTTQVDARRSFAGTNEQVDRAQSSNNLPWRSNLLRNFGRASRV